MNALNNPAEPTGPECADPECTSYQCRVAHEYHAMREFMSRYQALKGMRVAHMLDARDWCTGGPWEPHAEVDHQVWKAYVRAGVANMTAVIARAKAEGQLPADLKVRFSRKAGCGCGCSPGFRVKAGDVAPGTAFYLKEES